MLQQTALTELAHHIAVHGHGQSRQLDVVVVGRLELLGIDGQHHREGPLAGVVVGAAGGAAAALSGAALALSGAALAVSAVAAACLSETTSIGLRTRIENRVVLPRVEDSGEVPGTSFRRKTVIRPDGQRTVKAEADDLAGLDDGRAGRERIRRLLESKAGGE